MLITLGNLLLPLPRSLRERLSPLPAKRLAAVGQESCAGVSAAATHSTPCCPQLNG